MANDWWRARQAAIDAEATPTKYDEIIGELARRKSWAVQHGENEEAAEYDK